MRHQKRKKQLGRDRAHRKALVANLASALILNEYIVTTDRKAKVAKAYTDKIISIGKQKSLHSKRRIETLLKDKLAAEKVTTVLSDRYKDRIGGFVSMVKIGRRMGDNASLSKLILMDTPVPFKTRKPIKKGVKKTKNVKEEKKSISPSKEQITQVDERKAGVLERVKQLRGRIMGNEKSMGGGKNAVSKKVETRSRSGI